MKPALMDLARASLLKLLTARTSLVISIAVAVAIAIAKTEDRMARRAGPSPVVAVAAPTIIAKVVVAAAGAIRTITAPVGANLPLALESQTSLFARDLTGADAAPDALAVMAVIDALLAIAALRKRLSSTCQK